MQKVRHILALMAVLFLGGACQKETGPAEGSAGECSVIFNLSSQDALQLQTKTEAEDLLDGRRFENVLVILVDNSNRVVGNVYKEYPYDPTDPDNDPEQERVTESKITYDVIHFDHLNPGDYTAYAYANIDAEAWQNSGEAISDSGQEKATTSGDFTSFISRELKAVSPAPVSPASASESSMLLTGKVSVPVGLSVEPHIIYLQRPVVRFRVYVHNTTPYPVRVDDLRFSHFNADKAYLIDHSDESGIPAVPAGVTYGALPAYPILNAPSLETVPPSTNPSYKEEYLVYETLLYENASPNAYKVFATLTLDPNGSAKNTLSLGKRDFGVIDYDTIMAMDEGEQIDILLMNPQKSKRSGRVFCYISDDNYMAWESAGYETASGFFGRAQAIFTGTPTPYVYTATWDGNNDGYSAWYGMGYPEESGTFTYTASTKDTYLHTFSKVDGKYNILGLALNNANTGVVNGTSITGLEIEVGAPANGKIPSEMAGMLIRLKKWNVSQNRYDYIQANTNYNKDIARQQQSNLRLLNGGQTNQDRQFVMYGEYAAGGILKRILKDSNKEVPLSYMARNEDIKLVINVFYADQEATLNFDVDNSTWETPISSSHTFK